ncbi:high mobility group B1 [Actinidia rufa]|uniref:High mobility group B1 n=1 Tax=Actinidia rufa TaxID=165716 RepID=A0A7J0E8V2_9ERIC|nr:high mobility group B1 [Actinidia rufa]
MIANCSINVMIYARPQPKKRKRDDVGKRKAVAEADKSSKRKPKKEKPAKKDPNKPKRPPSAFFVFLEEFRKTFKKENPNVKAVSAVGKAGGEKWKSLSKSEKAPYEAKAAKKKSEYEKLMNAYNKKQESMDDDGDEESERSKSEVNDEDDEGSEQVISSSSISVAISCRRTYIDIERVDES